MGQHRLGVREVLEGPDLQAATDRRGIAAGESLSSEPLGSGPTNVLKDFCF
jgi:hypothetical protein